MSKVQFYSASPHPLITAIRDIYLSDIHGTVPTNSLLGRYDPVMGTIQYITVGSNLTLDSTTGVLSATGGGGGGSISSITLTAPSWLTVTGSPLTSSGTLDVSAATGLSANSILATPDSTSGSLAVRSLVTGDIPNLPWGKITSGIPTTLSGYGITDGVNTTQLGIANGVATLDSAGTLTASQLPASIVGAVVYKGVWNASTNTPTLTSGTGTNGFYYIVSVAGSTTLNGNSTWVANDIAIFNGTVWNRIPGSSANVTSIYGRTGTVTAQTGDYTASQVGAVPTTRTLNINGTAYDLSANRSWTVTTGGTVTSITATSPLTGGTITTSGTIGIAQSSASVNGYLSSTDWSVFNSKLSSYTETDPVFAASAAHGISGSDITSWTAKQAALLGTGFVKISGTTISYDNSTYLTGNQSITVSGDISGSGTTAITATIGASKVTNTMLAGSVAASKLIGTDIATVGTITSGIWQGTPIIDTYISSAAVWNAKQAVLSGTGFVKSTAGTISYDTSTYLTGNQTITLTGAVTGSGSTSIATTLASSIVGTTNLSATGTPSSTTFLRGDNTWGTPAGGGGTPGGSTTQVQYNNAGAFAGASQAAIASDGNLQLVSATGLVTAPSVGNAKIYSNNRTGVDEIRASQGIGSDVPLQNSMGYKVIGMFVPGTNALTGLFNFAVGASMSGATIATVNKAYDSANMLPNFTYVKGTSAASATVATDASPTGSTRAVMVGNNTYGGGAKLVITFGLPTYASSQRIFAGYSATVGGIMGVDPSGNINIVGVAKDAGDSTFVFINNDSSGTCTRTTMSTPITPNINNVYRVTIFIPSNSTTFYTTFETITKSGITVSSTSASSDIPAAGVLLIPHVGSGTAASSTAVTMGIIQVYEEQY